MKVLWPLQKRLASEDRARSTLRWRLPEKRSWYDDDSFDGGFDDSFDKDFDGGFDDGFDDGFDGGFDKDFDDGDNNNSNETCL